MQITFWYPFHVARAELRRPGAEAVPPWGLRPCALHHLSLSIAPTAWVSNTWNKGQLCFFPNMLCFSGVKAWFFHALPSSFSFALWSVYCGNIFLVASPTPLACVYFPICDGIQMMLLSERNTFPGYGFCCLFLPASKTRQHLNPEDLRGIEEIGKGQREWLWTVKVK